ncbi:cell wall elongation regulator TseB-like domain-containing protein [Aquibacillus rhizosphaerae]|uniref:DUF5590 domain-containing protein n=1 Tax=Aquibacillus rhizosphaerae TaxID=3051431 RepID=A0ABT7L4N7_9BACI|nr:DUF5590 domain-containing protein [Aquibacillus sp. LR5S19]MDL4840833.1 DUF5590 domain-containing protein [Aquibacillus sp. LR5S19]
MIKRYSPFTAPSWFKLSIVVFLIIFFGIISYSVYVYSSVQENKTDGFEQSKVIAKEETELVSVDDVTRYHGDIYYHVVFGETESGESAVAYVPVENEDESIQFFLTSEFVYSREDVLNEWRSECSSCELYGVNLGIHNNLPVWETKYINGEDRFVFKYYPVDGSMVFFTDLKRSLY